MGCQTKLGLGQGGDTAVGQPGSTRGGQGEGQGLGNGKKVCGSGCLGSRGWGLTLGWKAPCREPKETAGGRPGGRPGTVGGKAAYGCGEKGPVHAGAGMWPSALPSRPLASTLKPPRELSRLKALAFEAEDWTPPVRATRTDTSMPTPHPHTLTLIDTHSHTLIHTLTHTHTHSHYAGKGLPSFLGISQTREKKGRVSRQARDPGPPLQARPSPV